LECAKKNIEKKEKIKLNVNRDWKIEKKERIEIKSFSSSINLFDSN
jgi:hypothetical protein